MAAFNSLFEMLFCMSVVGTNALRRLSILYLRCPAGTSPVGAAWGATFNSLFEMQKQNSGAGAGRRGWRLSILYLRCIDPNPRTETANPFFPFNSLFEMRSLSTRLKPLASDVLTFNSLFEMPVGPVPPGVGGGAGPFNSLFEMPVTPRN